VLKLEKISRTLEDNEIKKAIISQLKLKHVIESNSKIVKKMSNDEFGEEQFEIFSKKKKLEIQKITIRDIKNESIFNSSMIKEIFKMNDGEIQLITNSQFDKNYIILAKKTKILPFNKKDKNYKQYKTKARLNLANQIYRDYDKTVNNKYNVKINENVLNRIKNTL